MLAFNNRGDLDASILEAMKEVGSTIVEVFGPGGTGVTFAIDEYQSARTPIVQFTDPESAIEEDLLVAIEGIQNPDESVSRSAATLERNDIDKYLRKFEAEVIPTPRDPNMLNTEIVLFVNDFPVIRGMTTEEAKQATLDRVQNIKSVAPEVTLACIMVFEAGEERPVDVIEFYEELCDITFQTDTAPLGDERYPKISEELGTKLCTFSTLAPSQAPTAAPTVCGREVIISIDTFEDVTVGGFRRMKKFAIKLVNHINVGVGATSVSIVQYAKGNIMKVKEEDDVEKLVKVIEDLIRKEGSASFRSKFLLHKNINYARKQFSKMEPPIEPVYVIFAEHKPQTAKLQKKAQKQMEKLRNRVPGIRVECVVFNDNPTALAYYRDLCDRTERFLDGKFLNDVGNEVADRICP